ncbi:hypothetical protein A2U01_0075046 [Trifolium medium]|uniref:Uncharacterized protein n=1 Tax=Trifolium medium TaxID=97028 RepID=A0A392SYM6_9FABA|nr:hypothetical protein [Trifolium medium]
MVFWWCGLDLGVAKAVFVAETHFLGVVAERGVWSLSELVASARQGSPVTLILSALSSL